MFCSVLFVDRCLSLKYLYHFLLHLRFEVYYKVNSYRFCLSAASDIFGVLLFQLQLHSCKDACARNLGIVYRFERSSLPIALNLQSKKYYIDYQRCVPQLSRRDACVKYIEVFMHVQAALIRECIERVRFCFCVLIFYIWHF